MPNYRRADVAGATYFFTVVTAGRAPILTSDMALRELRRSVAACRRKRPFELRAAVVLPDHLHMMWTLPPGDADFSTRWAAIKATFSAAYTKAGGVEQPISTSRTHRGHRGVWQKRFGEHLIRDESDWNNHLDYIHYNPVKHAHATCPHAWGRRVFTGRCGTGFIRRIGRAGAIARRTRSIGGGPKGVIIWSRVAIHRTVAGKTVRRCDESHPTNYHKLGLNLFAVARAGEKQP